VETARKRPEDFLELVHQAKRGRLKLYLGFAAGVGKTYRMLEEAHQLQARGVDVVLGYIETHGRAPVAALLDGLEIIPRKRIEYRGVTIEEMDLDAVLARRPDVAIVDELAHTNAPDSRNRRRYQDVLELVDAGVNVIGSFNIQHLESLNDLVERVTKVVVRETIPDTFLKRADQVVNLDLAVEDLLDRLERGQIYAPEKVRLALENFFKSENLFTLRELALREVAESLDRASAAQTGAASVAAREATRAAAGRVMVCMASFSPRAAALLRRGSRIAGRLNTSWFVAYVETPGEAPTRIDSQAQRHLLGNIEIARELGAEVVRLRGKDPVQVLLDFARSHGVAQIIIGRSQQPWWRRLLHRTVMHRLVDQAPGFDLQIVSLEDEGAQG
jgi:two-component system sensor histidine kinase KdpD